MRNRLLPLFFISILGCYLLGFSNVFNVNSLYYEDNVVEIKYDEENNYVFWIEASESHIMSGLTDLHGNILCPPKKIVTTVENMRPTKLEVANKKILFKNKETNHSMRCNYNGTDIEVLVNNIWSKYPLEEE